MQYGVVHVAVNKITMTKESVRKVCEVSAKDSARKNIRSAKDIARRNVRSAALWSTESCIDHCKCVITAVWAALFCVGKCQS